MNRAMPRIEFGATQQRRLPVAGLVLEQRSAAGAAPTETAADHVEVAVAVEVGGTDIGHATEQSAWTIGTCDDDRSLAAAEPHDGAVGMIGGLERSQVAQRASPRRPSLSRSIGSMWAGCARRAIAFSP